jgi:hypothetical protein
MSAPPDPALWADRAVTRDREETKYLIPVTSAWQLLAELDQRLPPHRFRGEFANSLPDAQHFVSTVYFDTPSRAQLRAAVRDVDRNVKVRGKEYYDLHPSLAELATDPAQILYYQPFLWFELKERDGERTFKHRFRLPKHDVPAFFAGRATPDVSALDEDARHSLERIDDFRLGLGEPLVASALVSYRRKSWQIADGSLRITLDLDVAFFAPGADLWTRAEPLSRSRLGVPAGVHDTAVLEVKKRASAPQWLARALDAVGAEPSRFSKFVAASLAVGQRG